MTKKSGKKFWLILLLCLSAAGIAAAVYAKMSQPNTAIEASRLAVVERGDITKSVVATGRIEPIAKVEIKAKAAVDRAQEELNYATIRSPIRGGIGLLAGVGLCQLVNLLPLPARFAGMIITWQTAVFALVTLCLIGIVARVEDGPD